MTRHLITWSFCTICKWRADQLGDPICYWTVSDLQKVMVINQNRLSYKKTVEMQQDMMQQSVLNWECTVSMGTGDQRVLDIAVRMMSDSKEANDLFLLIIIPSLRPAGRDQHDPSITDGARWQNLILALPCGAMMT